MLDCHGEALGVNSGCPTVGSTAFQLSLLDNCSIPKLMRSLSTGNLCSLKPFIEFFNLRGTLSVDDMHWKKRRRPISRIRISAENLPDWKFQHLIGTNERGRLIKRFKVGKFQSDFHSCHQIII